MERFQKGEVKNWEAAAPGIQRQLYGFDVNIMMVRVMFEKGAIGEEHRHTHTQVTYVESGTFQITIAGETQLLTAGDGFFVPSNELHGSVCMEEGILIDVFTPQRKDLLINSVS